MLDFWTYCSINCQHVLSDIDFLQQKFAEEQSIAFVGCHSAKFSNEKNSGRVREAVQKFEVKFPVVNDEKMQIWKGFERRSWPSQVVVSPKSQMPILILQGEGMRQVLDLFISVAYDFYYESLNH